VARWSAKHNWNMAGRSLKRMFRKNTDVELFSWDETYKKRYSEPKKPQSPDDMKKALFAAFGIPLKK
jgi:hypothetical protein